MRYRQDHDSTARSRRRQRPSITWGAWIGATFILTVAGAPARAVDLGLLWHLNRCWPDCIRSTCRDDYCPKPAPCVAPVRCFGCDDYQPKCAPCVSKTCEFVCDDYCPKCEPLITCPPKAKSPANRRGASHGGTVHNARKNHPVSR